MEDNSNQEADTIISDEELDLDLNLDGNDDVEVLKAQLEKERKARQQLTARAKAAEAKAKATHQTTNKEQTKDFFEDERFDLFSEGYSKETIKFIMKNGGKEVLKDPNSMVSIAVRTQMEQKKAEQAASQTADTSGMSELERKYTPEMLKNMTVKELEAIVPRA